MGKPHITYLDTAMLPVFIGFTSSEKKFDKEMARLGVKDYGGCYMKDSLAGATTWNLVKDGHVTLIVSIKQDRKPTDRAMIGLIAHECVHVLDAIIEACREDDKAGEFRAYTMQWLVQQFLNIYEKEWKERKKK